MPDISDVIAEMVNHGPHKEHFKRIYGTGKNSEIGLRKRAFECALDLYHREQAEKEQAEKELFFKKVLKEDEETSKIAQEASKKAQETIVLC